MSDVIIIGSGFAGLWAALGAARRLDELGIPAGQVSITVLSAQPFHDIRVRNYEADLSACRIPLADVLNPAGIAYVTAEVTAIDTGARTVSANVGGQSQTYGYDRLVLAAGSRVARPDIPGLTEFGFDVDTYDGAMKLDAHLTLLAEGPVTPAAATVVVVGAGLTGIETACELPGRLTALFGTDVTSRVVLVDHNPNVGSDMGASARPVIEAALSNTGVETLTGMSVTTVDQGGVTLSSDEMVPAATVIWCAGMKANPLTAQFPVERDRLGRLPVDDYLQVIGVPGVFAAGDVATAKMDNQHQSVMSCQHSRPMGRYAGYNVIGDLLGNPMLALRIPWYVTVLDLGPAGAVYTEGWDRQVVATGAQAKATKNTINTQRIYPPLTRDRAALLTAAAPELQTRPARGHQ
ncbi:NAD(P)/FAD-dependent oxidoreductase [Rhodococcus sp. WS3]|uniref:NAD(P)/FAD-dependent oxidoreductase n=1 Tax=unclassified Rhodococcus (in: high G+C Gram-positive bacteria) TaxID=192944 RepID=UPI0011423EAC|nr:MULTISPECIES: FAD-dependent oxidoreductase [unclassified Rhodococcus (in: high G+C Gram-positive bacteria)]ROZ46638.1 NAD(P)/FAD-dependent oxidoreductase [Rhodococcus sp. WS3]RZL22228.1 MAG: NAD(P)/FAD-dependent oxidoreductase [Rhodococcus sp. (in: high G+C Gram-positive bacteria)]